MSAGDWCLIESDPGVFTELIRGFGVTGVQVEELYTLDFAQLEEFAPIYGLIFLFKYRPGEEPSGNFSETKDVYFAQQVINNACATQALVNLLFNINSDEVTLGATLENFRAFSQDMDPSSRGLCLSNCQEMRTVHNNFARQNFLEMEGPKTGKDDAFHFTTYVPVNGHVYELDGLKSAPSDLGAVPEGKDWLSVVHDVLSARVQKHSTQEITFNLMALVADRKTTLTTQLQQLSDSGMETDENATEIYRLNELIKAEEEKFGRYRDENARRRHNYTPFIIELLKILAKENKLTPLVERAIEEEARSGSKKSVASS